MGRRRKTRFGSGLAIFFSLGSGYPTLENVSHHIFSECKVGNAHPTNLVIPSAPERVAEALFLPGSIIRWNR